jgi:hypothetical protein
MIQIHVLIRSCLLQYPAINRVPNEPGIVGLCSQGYLLTNEPY